MPVFCLNSSDNSSGRVTGVELDHSFIRLAAAPVSGIEIDGAVFNLGFAPVHSVRLSSDTLRLTLKR